jgi:hypothetical protein
LWRVLAGGFLQSLKLLDLALFFAFASQLFDLFALVQSALFLLPYALLVAEQRWVPRPATGLATLPFS